MKENLKIIIKEGAKENIQSLFDQIPIAGKYINQAINIRGKIKERRVLNFVEVFIQYIEDLTEKDISIDEIQKEEFGDFFEELLIKVSKTSSKNKLRAFSNLLKEKITNPKNIDYPEIILEIISELSEQHIVLLNNLKGACEQYNSSRIYILEKTKILNKLKEDQIKESNKTQQYNIGVNISSLLDALNKVEGKIVILNEDFNRNAPEYFFLTQNLCAKGLLVDIGISYGAKPYELVEFTDLGNKIYRFIEIN